MRSQVIFLGLMCTLILVGLTGCDDHEALLILSERLPNGRVGVVYGFVLAVEGDADEFLLVSGTTSALPSEADSISTAASALATISRNLTRKSPLAARPICVVRGGELTGGPTDSRRDGLKRNDAPPASASTTTNAVLFILMLNIGAASEFRSKADLRISIKATKRVVSGQIRK